MLRYGKPVADKLEQQVKQWVDRNNMSGKYVAIIMLGVDHPGSAYVSSKQKFANRVGLSVKIFGDENRMWTEIDILQLINQCNLDEWCVGIILQLPLPKYLEDSKKQFLDAIDRKKDIDGLGSFHQERKGLLPATPVAVLNMINYYNYDVQGKQIAMLGNSSLIGAPLAFALEYKGAMVKIFTVDSDQEAMKKFCREEADMIISATGSIHLVTKEFIRGDKSQVVIDVGRGYKDQKAVGDTMREEIENSVHAITPVPGGVGPVTVASLFSNIVSLQNLIQSTT